MKDQTGKTNEEIQKFIEAKMLQQASPPPQGNQSNDWSNFFTDLMKKETIQNAA